MDDPNWLDIPSSAEEEAEGKTKRIWIPRETWRQEKAVVFVAAAVSCPHEFLAHDRSQAKSPREHLWQELRGVRKGTPDTQLVIDGRHLWFEFKAPGQKVKPDDDQGLMLARLRGLGDAADWGVMITDLLAFYRRSGVPLAANADYLALKYDGMVDSRIAKEDAKQRGGVAPKTSRPRIAGPRNTATMGWARRQHKKGILV